MDKVLIYIALTLVVTRYCFVNTDNKKIFIACRNTFSRDRVHATLEAALSVRPSIRPSVGRPLISRSTQLMVIGLVLILYQHQLLRPMKMITF